MAATVEELIDGDKQYYEVLGLEDGATVSDVKAAYRRLILTHHPDKRPNHPNAIAEFHTIVEAYSVLKDAGKRRCYDQRVKKARKKAARGYTQLANWAAGELNVNDPFYQDRLRLREEREFEERNRRMAEADAKKEKWRREQLEWKGLDTLVNHETKAANIRKSHAELAARESWFSLQARKAREAADNRRAEEERRAAEAEARRKRNAEAQARLDIKARDREEERRRLMEGDSRPTETPNGVNLKNCPVADSPAPDALEAWEVDDVSIIADNRFVESSVASRRETPKNKVPSATLESLRELETQVQETVNAEVMRYKRAEAALQSETARRIAGERQKSAIQSSVGREQHRVRQLEADLDKEKKHAVGLEEGAARLEMASTELAASNAKLEKNLVAVGSQLGNLRRERNSLQTKLDKEKEATTKAMVMATVAMNKLREAEACQDEGEAGVVFMMMRIEQLLNEKASLEQRLKDTKEELGHEQKYAADLQRRIDRKGIA